VKTPRAPNRQIHQCSQSEDNDPGSAELQLGSQALSAELELGAPKVADDEP